MKTKTAREWNIKAATYSKMASSKKDDAYEYLINFPSILSLCPSKANKVLDLGTGGGDFAEILSKRFKIVEGSDVSPNMVNIAQKRFSKIRFFLLDLEDKFSVISDNSYDLIVCKLVLMFVKDIDNVAKETFRIINHGGYLIVSVPHPLYWTSKYLENKFIKNRPEFAVMKNGYFSEVPITKSIGDNENLVFDFICRKIQTYINTFTKHGFLVDKISEPELTKIFIKKYGNNKSDIPVRLNIRFIKK